MLSDAEAQKRQQSEQDLENLPSRLRGAGVQSGLPGALVVRARVLTKGHISAPLPFFEQKREQMQGQKGPVNETPACYIHDKYSRAQGVNPQLSVTGIRCYVGVL